MKRIIIALTLCLALLATCAFAEAANLAGEWQCLIEAEGMNSGEVTFILAKDGGCTLIYPEQYTLDDVPGTYNFDGETLILSLETGAEYTLIYDADANQFVGEVEGRTLTMYPAETATKEYQLGTSVYTIEIAESFEEGERSEEDVKDDMVAYMHSPDTLLDFDVYQFSKDGYPDTLAAFVEQEAAEYEAAEVVTDGSINGIDAGWYRATETYEDQEYATLTYVLEDGDQYVELAFWLDGETAEEEAQAIINTLTFVER